MRGFSAFVRPRADLVGQRVQWAWPVAERRGIPAAKRLPDCLLYMRSKVNYLTARTSLVKIQMFYSLNLKLFGFKTQLNDFLKQKKHTRSREKRLFQPELFLRVTFTDV